MEVRHCTQCCQILPEELTDDKIEFIQNLRGVRRIVINKQHGGFTLSNQAVTMYLEMINTPYELREQIDRYSQEKYGSDVYVNGEYFHHKLIERDDPALVAVVKKLGDAANGPYTDLKIVTIPGDVEWQIEDYDGLEWVAEVHRIWR